MIRNASGQFVGAELINKTNGDDFTGQATLEINIDNAGFVASDHATTHGGNGWHVYTPLASETDGAHIVYQFYASGAVTSGVQVYPSYPQTGDAYDRLGEPAGASVVADIAANKTVVDGIQTDLSNGTDGLGALKILIDAVNTDLSNGTDGLGALKILIDAANTSLGHGTYGLSALQVLIAALQTDLSNGTDGLGALKILIDAANTSLGTMSGADGVKLATLQGLYAPAKAGDEMKLEDSAIVEAKFGTGAINNDALAANAVSKIVTGLHTTTMTQDYAANGAEFSLLQGLYAIHQVLMQFGIIGTTYGVRKLDNTTPAFSITLDSASAPTDNSRV